jgi:hypothetical protein
VLRERKVRSGEAVRWSGEGSQLHEKAPIQEEVEKKEEEEEAGERLGELLLMKRLDRLDGGGALFLFSLIWRHR